MIKFKNWRMISEGYPYLASQDGKPLEPHTISGAKNQIYTLASHIRTTFLLDDSFAEHYANIRKACDLLKQAEDLLSQNMDDIDKPHRFN